jgi:hypothetical protein
MYDRLFYVHSLISVADSNQTVSLMETFSTISLPGSRI